MDAKKYLPIYFLSLSCLFVVHACSLILSNVYVCVIFLTYFRVEVYFLRIQGVEKNCNIDHVCGSGREDSITLYSIAQQSCLIGVTLPM